MLFQLNLDGSMIKVDADDIVYQGSNNVNKIYVMAPYRAPVGLQMAFTLPNGTTTVHYPMQFEGNLTDFPKPIVLNNVRTEGYSLWSLVLMQSATELAGTVGVSVNAVSTTEQYSGNITSYTSSFEVEYSAMPVVPEYTDLEFQELYNLLESYYSQNAQMLAETIVTYKSLSAINLSAPVSTVQILNALHALDTTNIAFEMYVPNSSTVTDVPQGGNGTLFIKMANIEKAVVEFRRDVMDTATSYYIGYPSFANDRYTEMDWSTIVAGPLDVSIAQNTQAIAQNTQDITSNTNAISAEQVARIAADTQIRTDYRTKADSYGKTEVYTKGEVNDTFRTKADSYSKSDVYSKQEDNAAFAGIQIAINENATKIGGADISEVAPDLSEAVKSLNDSIDALQGGIIPRINRGIMQWADPAMVPSVEQATAMSAKIVELTGRQPNNSDRLTIEDSETPDEGSYWMYNYWTGYDTLTDGWYWDSYSQSGTLNDIPSYLKNIVTAEWGDPNADGIRTISIPASTHQQGITKTVFVDLYAFDGVKNVRTNTFSVDATGNVTMYTDEVFSGYVVIRSAESYFVEHLTVNIDQVNGLQDAITSIKERIIGGWTVKEYTNGEVEASCSLDYIEGTDFDWDTTTNLAAVEENIPANVFSSVSFAIAMVKDIDTVNSNHNSMVASTPVPSTQTTGKISIQAMEATLGAEGYQNPNKIHIDWVVRGIKA